MATATKVLDGYEEEARGYDLILRSYEARGPRPPCAALQGSLSDLLQFFTRLTHLWGPQRAGELASVASMDQMGKDQIFYFPGWTYYSSDKDEKEEDDA